MFTIDEIIKATHAKVINSYAQLCVSGISTDSRMVKQGELFIAIKGAKLDGHDFVDKARENQASALLVNETWAQENIKFLQGLNMPVIVAENTVAALGAIAGFHRRRFNIPVIGITGSNGKTSTKEMLGAVLGSRFKVLKSKASFNNNIGVPLTLLGLDLSHEIAVLEMGMNHAGEIRALCFIAKPDIAIITNVANAHMEFFKSLEEVAKAKCEILENLNNRAKAIINADCSVLYAGARDYGVNIISFGLKPGSLYRAANVLCDSNGIAFSLNEKVTFRLNLLGEHNVYNALAAIAVADLFKIETDQMIEALRKVSIPGLRMHQIDTKGIKIIADCYNANPISTKAAIKVLSCFKEAKRKVFVFADMLELGRSSRRFHEDIGEYVAGNAIDKLIAIGPNASFAASSAIACGMKEKDVYKCEENEDALEILQGLFAEDDIVLFKGSRGMHLEDLINKIIKNRG